MKYLFLAEKERLNLQIRYNLSDAFTSDYRNETKRERVIHYSIKLYIIRVVEEEITEI